MRINEAAVINPESVKTRSLAMDVFRGLTLAAMMVVNNPGSGEHVFAPLEHATWNGWTPTDLIFPFFLFLVGMAIPWSFRKYLEQPGLSRALWVRVARRTVLLFLLGLILNVKLPFQWEHLRFLGVLQRIALCYGAAALTYGWLARRVKNGAQSLPWVLGGASLGLLVLYFVLMKFVPVPGYGAGRLDLPEGNLAAYIDRLLLHGHLWRYADYRWDPEGLFSTLPALATTLLGVLCTWWLQKTADAPRRLWKPVLVGAVLIAAAYALAPVFPINKSLWSSSYVLLTSGLALIVYAGLHWLLEIKSIRFFAPPFLALGSNAIAVYFLSTWTAIRLARTQLADGASVQAWIYQHYFIPLHLGQRMTSLLYAALYALLWLAVAWILYRRRIFIRL